MDGWSSRLLVSELEATHTTLQQGFSPDNSPEALQYVDFAIWQRSQLSSSLWRPQVSSAQDLMKLSLDMKRPIMSTSVRFQTSCMHLSHDVSSLAAL